MDKELIQKLLDANLEHLASRAANPRATLGAVAQKIAGAIEGVEAQLAENDLSATELPAALDEAVEKLKKLDAIVEKARNDGRADLEQAALGRRATQEAAIQAIRETEGQLDAGRRDLEELLSKLQMKQVDVDGAIASAPAEPVGVRPPAEPLDLDAMTPAAAASLPGSKLGGQVPSPRPASPPVASAPKAAASAPKAVAPTPKAVAPAPAPKAAAKGGDDLDDAFAALLAAENLSLDDIELPKKSQKKSLPLPDSDDGIPDLVMVSDSELPDDATDEDRAPIPTAPPKGAAAPKGAAPTKAAPPAPARAASPGAKLAAPPPPGAKIGAPPAGPAAPVGKLASTQGPPAPAKRGRAWVWVTAVVVIGGGGAAIAHFVYGLF